MRSMREEMSDAIHAARLHLVGPDDASIAVNTEGFIALGNRLDRLIELLEPSDRERALRTLIHGDDGYLNQLDELRQERDNLKRSAAEPRDVEGDRITVAMVDAGAAKLRTFGPMGTVHHSRSRAQTIYRAMRDAASE